MASSSSSNSCGTQSQVTWGGRGYPINSRSTLARKRFSQLPNGTPLPRRRLLAVLVTTRVMASRLSYLYQHFPSGYPSLRSFVNDRHRFDLMAMCWTIWAFVAQLDARKQLRMRSRPDGASCQRIFLDDFPDFYGSDLPYTGLDHRSVISVTRQGGLTTGE